MAKPAKCKMVSSGLFVALVSAWVLASIPVRAGDEVRFAKDQDRHPEIGSFTEASGNGVDVILSKMPPGARDVIIALADGGYLIQRYYPSGYSIVIKPRQYEISAEGDGILLAEDVRPKEAAF